MGGKGSGRKKAPQVEFIPSEKAEKIPKNKHFDEFLIYLKDKKFKRLKANEIYAKYYIPWYVKNYKTNPRSSIFQFNKKVLEEGNITRAYEGSCDILYNN